MSYPMLTNKQTAQVVHLNWVKSTKKLHLRRDNLWFLTEDDQRCAAGFDPFEGGCARACVPATTCEMGRPCIYDSTCDHIWRRMTSNRIARERGQGGEGAKQERDDGADARQERDNGRAQVEAPHAEALRPHLRLASDGPPLSRLRPVQPGERGVVSRGRLPRRSERQTAAIVAAE